MTTPDKSLKQDNQQKISVSRRDMLIGMGVATGLAYASSSIASESAHDHSKHRPQKPGMLNAANLCVDKGQRCIAHCLVTFQEGNTDLAVCASKVNEMQEICTAFAYLLSANSSYITEYSKIAEKVCQDCSDECRKHEKHHECRDCADACDELIDAISMQVS